MNNTLSLLMQIFFSALSLSKTIKGYC